MLKVGVYIRVSTDNVEQQTSLKNQRDFYVSPRDCDTIISSMSKILASSIQLAILNN